MATLLQVACFAIWILQVKSSSECHLLLASSFLSAELETSSSKHPEVDYICVPVFTSLLSALVYILGHLCLCCSHKGGSGPELCRVVCQSSGACKPPHKTTCINKWRSKCVCVSASICPVVLPASCCAYCLSQTVVHNMFPGSLFDSSEMDRHSRGRSPGSGRKRLDS